MTDVVGVVRHVYISDETWDGVRYYQLRDPTRWGTPIVNWPLPSHRTYEMVIMGPTWYILHKASDQRPAPDMVSPPPQPFNHLAGPTTYIGVSDKPVPDDTIRLREGEGNTGDCPCLGENGCLCYEDTAHCSCSAPSDIADRLWPCQDPIHDKTFGGEQ